VKASELRPGMAINMDGQVWLVAKTEHVKPGKGGAFAATKLKNLKTGQNVERRFRSSEDVDGVTLDKRDLEFLYHDGTRGVFMDGETFEQYELSDELLGDALLYVKPNTQITGLFHEGQVQTIDLPATVDLEVKETPPGIKDATKTNQLKEAELETGLQTRVPPFINNGDVVRVSTEDGSYLSRVTG